MSVYPDGKGDETRELIALWLKGQHEKAARAIRFGFDDAKPDLGQRAILYHGDAVYFGVRTSQNYYQSGNLTIPADMVGLMVVSLKEYPNLTGAE